MFVQARPFLFLLFTLTAACVSDNEADQSFRPVSSIYNEARGLMYEGRYKKAAEMFNEAERQHPYSWWALKGQVMAVFCYYKANKYEEAVLVASRFAQLHPTHPDIPYVLYIQGLSHYERLRDAPRDQRHARAARTAFEAIKNRFPGTAFAKKSAEKILFLENVESGKNMHIGRFYQNGGDCIAALGRYRVVVEEFQQTEQIQEALYRMGECYLSMGMIRDAVRVVSLLGHNYPENIWYRRGLELFNSEGINAESEDRGLTLSGEGGMSALLDKGKLYRRDGEN